MKKTSRLTYKKAGVDIEKGDQFIDVIRPLAKRTFRPEVLTSVGSFSALFKLNLKKYRNPVLVSGTDGVGTKLKIAFMANRHDTVGIDLVAMCVNDILTSGAEPLFFLDYFATGKLATGTAARVIAGIADGCEEAGCALIGGETAEMPGFYRKGEYDLSGFVVGIVEKDRLIDGSKIREGDAIIGLSSNGLHSNGFSLVRKIFFDAHKMNSRKYMSEFGSSLEEELLRPTRIYTQAFNSLKGKIAIKGMAHITGGGIPGNVKRIIPKGLKASINYQSWPSQPIFQLIQKTGNVPHNDMKKTFNMGIGYIVIVDQRDEQKALLTLQRNGFDSYAIGAVEKILRRQRGSKAP
jgi:phosphoribosylformylglycinamidine cyclo-ligase